MFEGLSFCWMAHSSSIRCIFITPHKNINRKELNLQHCFRKHQDDRIRVSEARGGGFEYYWQWVFYYNFFKKFKISYPLVTFGHNTVKIGKKYEPKISTAKEGWVKNGFNCRERLTPTCNSEFILCALCLWKNTPESLPRSSSVISVFSYFYFSQPCMDCKVLTS